MLKQDEAIILQTQKWRESDLLVTFFCKEEGKKKGVARGAKNSKRRFPGTLEMGSIVSLNYSENPNGDLHVLTEASILELGLQWRESWISIATASYILELVTRLLVEQPQTEKKFRLLKFFLKFLNEQTSPLLLFVFQFQWLCLSGLTPNMEGCAICKKTLSDEEEWQLFLERGEMFCKTCRREKGSFLDRTAIVFFKTCEHAIPLFEYHADRLETESSKNLILGEMFSNPPQKWEALLVLFDRLWQATLGKPLVSRKLLEKLFPIR